MSDRVCQVTHHPELEQIEFLAQFLLEHDHCGDDYWEKVAEQRREWYRSLAQDVLRALHREGLIP